MAKTITPLSSMDEYKGWRLKSGSLSMNGKEITRDQFSSIPILMHNAFQQGLGEHFERIPEEELVGAGSPRTNETEKEDETKKKGKPA